MHILFWFSLSLFLFLIVISVDVHCASTICICMCVCGCGCFPYLCKMLYCMSAANKDSDSVYQSRLINKVSMIDAEEMAG